MTEPNAIASAFETVYVTATEVTCDGDNAATGHPRVFLHILSDTGSITCPYCSRTFVHRELGAA